MARNTISRVSNNILGFLTHPPVFVRSIYAETMLEDFFVSAIASLLLMRFYLYVTGFPQLTIGPLHISHTLLGGLLMLIAMVILLAFVDHSAKIIAAILGGMGFGLFIDELGKFITKENDYFFQPAIAVIYIVFVFIFFLIRTIGKRTPFSTEECLANVFDIAKQGSLLGLARKEQEEALQLLENCEVNQLRDNLGAILKNVQVAPARPPRPIARFSAIVDKFYKWAASQWWFGGIVITFFAFTAVTSVAAVVAAVEWSLGLILWIVSGLIMLGALVLWSRRVKTGYHLDIIISVSIVIVSILISWAIVGNLQGRSFSIIQWAQFVFPAISGILITIGILLLPRSRLQAYLMFWRATLVSIFLTQVLSFYEQQFFALLGLILNILILIALRYIIAHENGRNKS